MNKAKEYWNRYRTDIAAVAVLCIVFGGLCLYRLLQGGEYSGDEFFSLEDTLGYAYTGKKLEWDFHAGAVSDRTVRLNPYFYLLAWWVRLAGTQEFLLRSLSVIIGIAVVVSFYYTVRRMTGSTEWACMAGLLLCANQELLTVSTIVRGYALLLLLMVWIFYFSYRALHYISVKEKTTRIGRFLHKWLDFDYRYALAVLLLLYVAYRIRPFAVLYVLGVGVYILVRAVWTKEKKFMLTGGLFWGSIAFFCLATAFHLDHTVRILAMISDRIRKFGSIGLHNPEYWREAGQVFLIVPLTVFGACLAVWNLCRDDSEKEQKQVLLYMLLTALSIVAVFTVFVNWPHNVRYLLAVYPPAAVAVSGGFYLTAGKKDWKDKVLLYGVLLLCLSVNLSSLIVGREDGEHFSDAYRTVAEYTGGEPILITGINLRGYYARDIIPGYVWQPMTNKVSGEEIDHLAEICEIGRAHPQGIITCEDSRWYHFRNSFWLLLNQDTFEKITGAGVDETNVENWAYHLAFAQEGRISEDDGNVTMFGYNFGGRSRTTEEEGRTVLELELNGSVPELTMLCVKVNQYYAGGERRQRYVQLILEPNGQSVQYYRIVLENQEIPVKSMLDDCYTIYNNGEDPESFEDCYTLP